jgi:hypothetical protein
MTEATGTTKTDLVVQGHIIDNKMRVYSLDRNDLMIGRADRDVLRKLAGQVAELAARPIEDEKRELWYRHNALESTRPVIYVEPEDGWREIVPEDSLECEGIIARQWEMYLRKLVFSGAEMSDDYVVAPFFNVSHVHPKTHWGLQEEMVGGEIGGRTAITWEAPLRSYEEDLPKVCFPEIKIDYEGTELLAGLADEILGDLLTVRVRTHWWWSMGLTIRVAFLRGLSEFMYDLILESDNVHRLMAVIRDGLLSLADYVEANDLLFLNNDESYVGSGGLGFTRELPQPDCDGRVRLRDTWGTGESQESVGVSPKMYAEFIFPYELPLLQRFGLVCYGCCEPVDKRWHVIKQIPNLRRVSVSAWADWARTAEMLGDQYIYSMKPSPAPLAIPSFDEEAARADLRRGLEVTRGCHVEIIMKDNHTINNDPRRLIRWVQMAREEVDKL